MTGREKRLLILLGVILCIAGVQRVCRRPRPERAMESKHYIAYATSPEVQTRAVLERAEAIYKAYRSFMETSHDLVKDHPKLKLRVYKDRREFRRHYPGAGWLEAFYSTPYCCQYIETSQPNPYHWMVHEAVHQLNCEVARLRLAKWLDEGLACYFGASLLTGEGMALGKIDVHAYPAWWLRTLGPTGDMAADIETQRFIPLAILIQGSQGPDLDEHFNTYYLQWWSLVHFCLHGEQGRYRAALLRVIDEGGSEEAFVRHVGPLDQVQAQWYAYLKSLRDGQD